MIKKTWITEWEIKVAICFTEKMNVISAINIMKIKKIKKGYIQCMKEIKTKEKEMKSLTIHIKPKK